MALTEEQRAAAEAAGSVAVTAGAGTGKTHMLAERYLFHLRAWGLRPIEVVALTFTNKAAAELRSRVRHRLKDLLAADPTALAALPSACDPLAELEAAQMTTFHALAARLVREAAALGLLGGVPPDFSLLTELAGAMWQADRLDRALDALPGETYDIVPYSTLKRVIEALLADPLTAGQALACDRSTWLATIAATQQAALTALRAEPVWQDGREFLGRCAGKPGDKAEVARQTALESIAAIDALPPGGSAEPWLAKILAIKLNGGSKKAWEPPELFTKVKDHLKKIRELVENEQKAGLVSLAWRDVDDRWLAQWDQVRSAFDQVRSFLEQEKWRAKQLDFNDLEVYALKALDNPAFRDRCQRRWRAYLVDEFQDTNRVQSELLDRLVTMAGETSAQTVTLPVTLPVTIVGDEKQSIYRFRRAEVKVFQEWRDRLGQAVKLTTSFRSHDRLVRACNALCENHLPGFVPLVAAREPQPHAGPPVTLYLPDRDSSKTDRNSPKSSSADRELGDGDSAEDGRSNPGKAEANAAWFQAEAQHLVQQIQTWLAQGLMIHTRGGPAEAKQPIAYRDIAILTRTWNQARQYTAVLQAAGLPVAIGGGDLLDTAAARDGFSLLRFLADPSDSYALLGLLRSPMVALSDRTLAQLAQTLSTWATTQNVPADGNPSTPAATVPREDQRPDWWGFLTQLVTIDPESAPAASLVSPEIPAAERDRLAWAIGVLGDLLRQRSSEQPSRLLQWADRATGYTAVLAALVDGPQQVADWRAWLAVVRDLEEQRGDVLTVVRQLNQTISFIQRQNRDQVWLARPTIEAGDAIAVMTIHGSKGLEWPIVIVPGLNHKGQVSRAGVYFDRDIGVAWRWRDPETQDTCEPALYRALAEADRQGEAAETQRLVYVALTRARDRLILSATDRKGEIVEAIAAGITAMNDRRLATVESFGLAEDSPTIDGGSAITTEPPSIAEPATNPAADTKPEPASDPLAGLPIGDWFQTQPKPEQEPVELRSQANPTAPIGPQWLLDRPGSGIDELPVTALTDYGRCPRRFWYRWVEGHPGRETVWDLDDRDLDLTDGPTDRPSRDPQQPRADDDRAAGDLVLGDCGDFLHLDLSRPDGPGFVGAALAPGAIQDDERNDGQNDGLRAKRIGILTHRAIEHNLTEPGQLQTIDPGMTPADWQEAIALADRFRQAPIYQTWRTTGQAEQAVHLRVGGLLMTGRADWVGPDFVLDFKTDRQINAQEHRWQLWAYARALNKPRAAIAYLRHDRLHEWTATDLDRLTPAAEALISAIQSGDFRPQPSQTQCEICPFQEICDSAQVSS